MEQRARRSHFAARTDRSGDAFQAFAFRHAQCRLCVQMGAYWCPETDALNRSLTDSDGACMKPLDAEESCGKIVASLGGCPTDAPNTKLTCTLCTLDSYVWCPSPEQAEAASDGEDSSENSLLSDGHAEYEGVCVPGPMCPSGSPGTKPPTPARLVSDCPSDNDTQMAIKMIIALLASLLWLLCCCCCCLGVGGTVFFICRRAMRRGSFRWGYAGGRRREAAPAIPRARPVQGVRTSAPGLPQARPFVRVVTPRPVVNAIPVPPPAGISAPSSPPLDPVPLARGPQRAPQSIEMRETRRTGSLQQGYYPSVAPRRRDGYAQIGQ